jgi:hypothetical protein
VFIPEGEPQFNGSVENFNGWFQEPLFQRRFRSPGDLRRELARLQEAVIGPDGLQTEVTRRGMEGRPRHPEMF